MYGKYDQVFETISGSAGASDTSPAIPLRGIYWQFIEEQKHEQMHLLARKKQGKHSGLASSNYKHFAVKTSVKIITGLLGIGMLIPGLAKFTEKFHSHFARQIELNGLPFPDLSFFEWQAALIVVSGTLIGLAFFWDKWLSQVASRVFILANLMVMPIFAVAIYVHLHPDVPAEILAFESKPPIMAIALISMAILNLPLFKNNHKLA